MKLLTVCIPCHNSIETMHKAIGSCLIMKDEIEIIVYDLNSSDKTYQVALEYQKEYCDTVKVIHSETDELDIKKVVNESTGLYFKMLNDKDYFDRAALVKVLDSLRDFIRVQANLDMIITNYKLVSDTAKDRRYSYAKYLPVDTIFSWHNIAHMKLGNYFVNHAIIIKKSILKDIIDTNDSMHHNRLTSVYGYVPYVKSIYYVPASLYCITKKDNLLDVNNVDSNVTTLVDLFNYYDIYSLKSRKQRNYMIKYLSLIYVITYVSLIKNNRLEDKNELDKYLLAENERLYKSINKTLVSRISFIDQKVSNSLLIKIYDVLMKLYTK